MNEGGKGAGFLGQLVGSARDSVSAILGPAAAEFGQLLADRVRLYRFQNLASVMQRAQKIADQRGMSPEMLHALPFGDALRTMEAASLEEDQTVQELWARLIANAAAEEQPAVSKMFIELLQSIGAAEAALLELVAWGDIRDRIFSSGADVVSFNTEATGRAAKWRGFSQDSRSVAEHNLLRLQCITLVPQPLDLQGLLMAMPTRREDRWPFGQPAAVDVRKFESFVNQVANMIFMTSGAIERPNKGPLSLRHLGSGWPFGHAIDVPEMNFMLTPLGKALMRACRNEL